MPEGLDKFAGAVGDVLKTSPTIYDDALQPTVQEFGKLSARIPRAINAAFSGLDKWILNKEYAIDETKKLLEMKLENVDPEKIVEPETYVAVPAIQAISYSMDSEELRNLYANLLAKAMNSDTKDLVHPSFVEIIKQMSPIDSLVFKTIMEREVNPLIDLIYKNEIGATSTIIRRISDINISKTEIVCVSIDNLNRQGLLSIPEDLFYEEEHFYNSLIHSKYYQMMRNKYPDRPDGFKFTHDKRMIEKTNLGKSFYEICVVVS